MGSRDAAMIWGYRNMEALKEKIRRQRDIISSLEKLNRNLQQQNRILSTALDGETQKAIRMAFSEAEEARRKAEALEKTIQEENERKKDWYWSTMAQMYLIDEYMKEFKDLFIKENEDGGEEHEDRGDAGEAGGEGAADRELRGGEQGAAE